MVHTQHNIDSSLKLFFFLSRSYSEHHFKKPIQPSLLHLSLPSSQIIQNGHGNGKQTLQLVPPDLPIAQLPTINLAQLQSNNSEEGENLQSCQDARFLLP